MTGPLHVVDTVAEGLALETDAFASNHTEIRLWTARQRALVCPASMQRLTGFEGAKSRTAGRGWPLHLRPTGGGAVPQGAGVLNLALGLTKDRYFTIEDGYRLITQIIRDALSSDLMPGATPDSFCDGAWNLAVFGRKVVGTAQRLRPVRQRRKRILIHALILTHGDITPGAAAVGMFHHDLGLGPVSAVAHITLESAFPKQWRAADELAARLYDKSFAALEAPSPHIGGIVA
ncbi:lipoyl protein ligase domain-containing protein [Roseovarius pelagicus]|uniref:BPL/LPL catalytic domain-containing protein n=1 Tax=Roseovarius pelagicus TaxID=2980108 RepID=A0ABY6D914_9RHOB|nr:hypothetical protein [Roseovarius pelagicus]UXX82374.1 hypothetical protein N7U68_14895 [Roseovarius pelagicus]